MRWPLMSRKNGVPRGRYEQVIDQRDEARSEAAQHVCKIVELCREIDALTDQRDTAHKRLADYGHRRTVSDVLEEHEAHRKALARAIDSGLERNWDQLTEDAARLRKAAAEWMADSETERKRADHLQARLDDALGLNTSQVEDGRLWQHTRTDKKGVTP
ncbi:hypothetical protein [Streptomyces sp. NPDC002573]|uniref:hypothetical protein n=1 Tax=Streptomyces sp. NPDC002573 TaxID=3364651 RepID=UPI00369EAFFA